MSSRHEMGWLRDLPDHRDFAPDETKKVEPTDGEAKIVEWFKSSRAMQAVEPAPPAAVDLTEYCSPVEDQGDIGACSANAGVALIEYYEKRAFGRYVDASRLFLYKVTRNLLGKKGDSGATLRATMKAMALFGAPPEKTVPYDTARFDDEPSAFAYAYASNFQSLSYFRLDQPNMGGGEVLQRIKSFLAAGYPSMFGFTLYGYGNDAGELSYPGPDDSPMGGHAVVAVGYDDDRVIDGRKGALEIRNSWGTGWGEHGYGWLPYEYVRARLAVDFWTLFRQEYVDTKRFA